MSKSEVIFRDVSFSYQNTILLENVSLDIAPGEFIGIIGPNGSGKTTLLKLIMGFITPTKGSIKISDASPYMARNKLAYVPQNMQYDRQFPISVRELVLTGLLSRLPWYGQYSSADKQAAEEALKHVGLIEQANSPFGTLSGGQAQRALIARALVSQPRLLLLDEPTAMVDSQAETEIYALLKSFRGKITVVMVTHDLNTVISQVDRIFCVKRTVTPLSPQEVCEHFALGLYHAPLLRQRSAG